jgi:NADP-dependent 3-hydroxy acid dehydrogenase YdfG
MASKEIVIVAGASGGFVVALARSFLNHGYNVTAAGRRVTEMSAVTAGF